LQVSPERGVIGVLPCCIRSCFLLIVLKSTGTGIENQA
jgi:hypothetical protein